MPIPEASSIENSAFPRPAYTGVEPQGADWLIEATGASKKYCRDLRRSLWYGVRDVTDALTLRTAGNAVLREHEFWAVENVSFQLRRGESLGLLGHNGAGKSTLLKLLTGQRSLSAGRIVTRGRIVALTELGLGFDPTLTGRENAYVNAAILGLTRRNFDVVIEDIINFSGLREFIDSAVQTYSSGMKARLGFSVATHLNPDILIVDEVLAVGDLEFRRKCVQHVLAYVRQGGSLVLVAHDPYLVQSMCNRCIVLERGKVVFDGSGIEGIDFHFRLGHSKQHDSHADASGRMFGDAAAVMSDAEMETGRIDAAAALEYGAGLNEAALPLPVSRTGEVELSAAAPVVVDRIELLPVDGGDLKTGSAVKVALHCRSSISREIVWGFTLCTADLQVNIATCAKGMDGRNSRLEPGENTLSCILRELPLQPGVYAVRGGVGDAATLAPLALRGYEDKPDFFTVVAAQISRTSNFQMVTNDLVKITTEWLS